MEVINAFIFTPFVWFFMVLIGIGIIVLLIFLILFLTKHLRFERLDYHVFSIPENKDPEGLFSKVIEFLNKLGYVGTKQNNRYLIKSDGVLNINIELAQLGRPIITYYVNVETWFVVLLLVLAIVSLLWLALVIGLIIYFRYDNVKRMIFSAISSVLTG